MQDSTPVLKYKFLEDSFEKMAQIDLDPRTCLESDFGLSVRNFGPEIKILGRNKFTAFDEHFEHIPTGIKVIIPDGHYLSFIETVGMEHTSLFVRPICYPVNSDQELIVSFFNFGEKEVVIPHMAILPVSLVALPYCKKTQLVSDLEYLDSQKEKNGRQQNSGV